MIQDSTTYYVWVGGSCDYGHKERASGWAYIPTAKSANADLVTGCIEQKTRHHSVAVKIVPYHKYPLLIETHDMAHEAMIKHKLTLKQI